MEAPRIVEVPLSFLSIEGDKIQALVETLESTANQQESELIEILKDKVKNHGVSR